MNILKIAFKNIADNPFRSWAVAICSALVAGLIIGATLVVRGTDESLQLVTQRLGADIAVIPSGNQVIVEQALLLGTPASIWMPRTVVDDIRAIAGVEVVSPQLFLSTMRGASCCTVSDMFMIAYDPASDFTVRPWLEDNLDRELTLGESIGGSYITYTEGRDDILIYGYEIDLVGSLEPTGSGLDQSLFFTYETALEIARLSPMQAEAALVISPDSISTALVRLEPDFDPYWVAKQIEATIPGVSAIPSAGLFRGQKERVAALQNSLTSLSIIAWLMSFVLIGFITTTAISARRQEIGVLRALGATRFTVIKILLLESSILSLLGGLAGVSLATAFIILFRNLIVNSMEVPLFIPTPLTQALLALAALAVILVSVLLATLLPMLKFSAEEPGTSIKE